MTDDEKVRRELQNFCHKISGTCVGLENPDRPPCDATNCMVYEFATLIRSQERERWPKEFSVPYDTVPSAEIVFSRPDGDKDYYLVNITTEPRATAIRQPDTEG